MGDDTRCAHDAPTFHLEYSTVTGFFLQDEADTDPANFEFMKSNFGLIDQPYDTDDSISTSSVSPTTWQRFGHKLTRLNDQSTPDVAYKLLFLGRHGQGFHNAAESFYGRKAWDCYYSLLSGNGTMTWEDAHLTALGISQAENVSSFWQSQIPTQHMPTPDLYFSSPLTRAIQTAELTFSPLNHLLPSDQQFHCSIHESLRECIGIHTCDRRSPLSTITKAFPPPTFTISPPFPESDPLWTPNLRESPSAQTQRLRSFLDDIFTHAASSKKTKYISLTSHGGTIMSILRAMDHRKFPVPTGGVIPVLIKIERRKGKRKDAAVQPWLPLDPEECTDVHLQL